jgi:hypothetical protein
MLSPNKEAQLFALKMSGVRPVAFFVTILTEHGKNAIVDSIQPPRKQAQFTIPLVKACRYHCPDFLSS